MSFFLLKQLTNWGPRTVVAQAIWSNLTYRLNVTSLQRQDANQGLEGEEASCGPVLG